MSYMFENPINIFSSSNFSMNNFEILMMLYYNGKYSIMFECVKSFNNSHPLPSNEVNILQLIVNSCRSCWTNEIGLINI